MECEFCKTTLKSLSSLKYQTNFVELTLETVRMYYFMSKVYKRTWKSTSVRYLLFVF